VEAAEGSRRMRGGDGIQNVQVCMDNRLQGRSSWLREARENVRQRAAAREVAR